MLKESWSLDGSILLARRKLLGAAHRHYSWLICTEINLIGPLSETRLLVEVVWEPLN